MGDPVTCDCPGTPVHKRVNTVFSLLLLRYFPCFLLFSAMFLSLCSCTPRPHDSYHTEHVTSYSLLEYCHLFYLKVAKKP